MLSFNQIYSEIQAQVQDDDATSLISIKRAINTGVKKFGAILNREWRNTNKTFSLVDSQQFYQMPEDCIRLKSVTITVGSVKYPLELIEDEDTWRLLTMTSTESSIPTHFYIRGSDEFGLYPTPVDDDTDAGSINYERRIRDMSAADYTTGTVSVTHDSAAVVGSGTTFTALMVGRSLKLDDAYGDGMWYKISTFTDATNITLENTYAGSTATGRSYSIGELPDIPEEYHEALVDYGCYRYYMRRKDKQSAAAFKTLFDEAVKDCKDQYSSKTTSQYYRKIKLVGGYTHRFPTEGVSS